MSKCWIGTNIQTLDVCFMTLKVRKFRHVLTNYDLHKMVNTTKLTQHSDNNMVKTKSGHATIGAKYRVAIK